MACINSHMNSEHTALVIPEVLLDWDILPNRSQIFIPFRKFSQKNCYSLKQQII